MTAEQLKQLETRFWKTADDLRANSKLTASEYSFPVLGLIFLNYVKVEKKLEAVLIAENPFFQ